MSTRAVVYARTSRADVEGRGLPGQLADGKEYALNKGYLIYREVSEDDRGASGAEIDLPGLTLCRDMARRGEYDILVVRELDRLSRSLAKQLIVEGELNRYGVRVEYVLATYDDTPEGQLRKHLQAIISEYERAKITERVVRGRRLKVQQGSVLVYQRPPYGYRVVKQAGGAYMLEIVPEEAEVIRLVFKLYVVEGMTLHAIANHLSVRSIPTWRQIHQRRAGAVAPPERWAVSSVRRILTNRTYTGTWTYHSGTVVTVEVPPIITLEIYVAAQRRLDQNRDFGIANTKREFLLARRLVCGHCGYKLSISSGSAYKCPSRFSHTPRHPCDLPGFRHAGLDALVWEEVEKILTSDDALKAALEVYSSADPLQDRLATIRSLLAEAEADIVQLQASLRKLTGARARAVVAQDLDSLENTSAKLRAEELDLVGRLGQQPVDDIHTLTEIRQHLNKLKEDDNFTTRRRIIDIINFVGTVRDTTLDFICTLGTSSVFIDKTTCASDNKQPVLHLAVRLDIPHSIVLPKRKGD